MITFQRLLAGACATSVLMMTGAATVHAQERVHVLHNQQDAFIREVWDELRQDFQAQNPDIEVELEFMDDQAMQQRLPTLLQASVKPNLYWSFGGDDYRMRAQSGLLGDITDMADGLRGNIPEGILEAYEVDGRLYGAPYRLAGVGFWYNRDLFEEAGVSSDDIETWDDFLDVVQALQDAGITPIAAGGSERWPLHFYWTYLAMRTGGQELFEAILNDEASFVNEHYIRAGEELQRLADLEPFQSGYMGFAYNEAAGVFGNGNAAIHLMGEWDIGVQTSESESGEGVSGDRLGYFNFPAVEGGEGDPSATIGGVDGFAFTSGRATEESVKWLEFFLAPEQQSRLAAEGIIIPVANGAQEHMEDQHLQMVAETIANSSWHQVFWDQALGASVGGVINDMSADLVAGRVTPEQAVQQIQEAWEFR
ncbi:extracellular solute-binding protein [Natronospirillum operosum]|uniref:Extracellular solute-binding protein n=1 Tax=Natronospirillum operosum TaxID=2759953 RepID=A0A4Z0W761_9GAMM|nr:extracellular solute-binding protein [Natronospirillum operosum]TGG91300.1 extracellular solute-binding protein [Natronospirillum operosum]